MEPKIRTAQGVQRRVRDRNPELNINTTMQKMCEELTKYGEGLENDRI
jgi:hypothetical protein